jgi:hypothetical protein
MQRMRSGHAFLPKTNKVIRSLRRSTPIKADAETPRIPLGYPCYLCDPWFP